MQLQHCETEPYFKKVRRPTFDCQHGDIFASLFVCNTYIKVDL